MNGFQRKIILAALEDSEPLSDRDYDFIQSIAEKDDDYEVSEKQNKWLNDISQKYL